MMIMFNVTAPGPHDAQQPAGGHSDRGPRHCVPGQGGQAVRAEGPRLQVQRTTNLREVAPCLEKAHTKALSQLKIY